MPTASVAKHEDFCCFAENGARWRCPDVSIATPDDDKWAQTEQDSGHEVCEPISNVLLGVNHSNLANQSANVDEKVEVVVDSRLRDCRIDNHTLTGGEVSSNHLGQWQLLSNQRGDVGLESTSANAHDD